MSRSIPLGLLEVSGLVRQTGSSAAEEYMFRHTLLQETAYNSLLRDQRAELHLKVGRAIEDLFRDGDNGKAAVLAEHFLKGGQPADALMYYRQAGDDAARVYALSEALDHYHSALSLTKEGYGDDEDFEYLYERRGRMFELSGQYEQALSTYEDMENIGEERGSSRLQLRGLVRRANLLCLPNPVMDFEEGEALSRRALRIAEEADDREAQALALWNLMKKNEFTENYSEAAEFGERALELADELELGTQRAFILHDLSQIHLSTGHFGDVLELIAEAQNLWRELDNLPMLADSLSSEMMIHIFRRDFDRALELSQNAREISERIGNLWGQSYSRYMVYWVHFDRGQVGKALEIARRSIELAEEAGFVVPRVQTHAEMGLIHAYMGEQEAARREIERGLENADSLFPQWRPAVLGLKLITHVWFDEMEEAEKMFREIQKTRPEGHKREISFVEFIYALAVPELGLAQGRYDFVLEETEWMMHAFQERGISFPLAETYYYRACALLATERKDEARTMLEQSLALMEETDSRRSMWSVLLKLADLAEDRGDNEKAAELRSRAVRAIEYIADHSASKAQRESFLGRPTVRNVLEAWGR